MSGVLNYAIGINTPAATTLHSHRRENLKRYQQARFTLFIRNTLQSSQTLKRLWGDNFLLFQYSCVEGEFNAVSVLGARGNVVD
jgi:hypothetical protein